MSTPPPYQPLLDSQLGHVDGLVDLLDGQLDQLLVRRRHVELVRDVFAGLDLDLRLLPDRRLDLPVLHLQRDRDDLSNRIHPHPYL